MSAIQLEFKPHYISAIDLRAAGLWAVIINHVKAIMDNNGSAINCLNEMMKCIYLFIYFELLLHFMIVSFYNLFYIVVFVDIFMALHLSMFVSLFPFFCFPSF